MKNMALFLFLCLLPVFAIANPGIQPDKIAPQIGRLEAGVICSPESVGSSPAPNTIAGSTHVIEEEPPFIAVTRRVPAVLGVGFGVKSQTQDGFGYDDVTMVITHPPMGDTGAELQSFSTSIGNTSPSLTFYQFDFDYELVPGIWQMTAMRDETVLYAVTFEVLPPHKVPELAAVCGFENLLS